MKGFQAKCSQGLSLKNFTRNICLETGLKLHLECPEHSEVD
jgi:hypothetical protein